MAYLLSAQTGERVTPAQLLGEEAVDVATREADAEKDLEKLQQRLKDAGAAPGQMLGAGEMVAVPFEGGK